jgi:hypothetical protein
VPAEPPWEELDPEIRPLVRVFYEEGLQPINSCQGHNGADAWVCFMPEDPGGLAGCLETSSRLKASLALHGWFVHAYVSINSAFDMVPNGEGSYAPGERWWVEVRWWGAIQYRELPETV